MNALLTEYDEELVLKQLSEEYFEDGMEAGLKKGLEKGELLKIIDLACKKKKKGCKAEETAKML